MSRLALGPVASQHLEARGATRTGARGDVSATTRVLAACGLDACQAVLEFEAAYGGLQLFESDPEAAALVVGPFACLSPGSYRPMEAGLAPVIFASDDVVYSLDVEGRGWTMAAMVEGRSRLSARSGRQLLTQAILWRALVSDLSNGELHQGACGAAWAEEAGLSPIDAASSDTERWWGDLDHLVVELQSGNGYTGPTTVRR